MVMKAITPSITATTKAPANNGIGWSKGMAPQLSSPNILVPLPHAGARIGLSDRPGTRRQRLIQNLVKQSVGDRAESERRRHHALFGKLAIAFRREFISGRARLAQPVVKFRRCLRLDFEMHVGESIAADLSCKAAKDARLIRGEVELRPHPVHGVDHA